MTQFYKSILEQDTAPVVICDLQHTIVYMNPAAIRRYAGFGGASLLGKSLMDCHNPQSKAKIEEILSWFAADRSNNRVYTSCNEKENKDVYMIALRGEDGDLIGYYEKHEYRNRETEGLYEALG